MHHPAAVASLAGISPRDEEMIEDGLIERSRAGDLAAFNQLVRRHYPAVYEVALRLLPCPDDAADVAQEVFIAAWRQLPRFQPRASFRTWLHAIALRQCARSRTRARRRPLSLENLDGPEPAAPDGAHDELERRERDASLHAAIQRLPCGQREAIALHYFGELTCAETAAAMGVSPGAVMTHLFRARKRLRELLGEP